MKKGIVLFIALMLMVVCSAYSDQEDSFMSAEPAEAEGSGFASVAAGDVITFGSYEQDNDPNNGPEPVEWNVLEVQDGKALLLSRYGLDTKPYNTEYTDVTWETCTLRSWLNNEFLNAAFSAEERSAILTTAVDNSDVQKRSDYDTSGGNDTEDQIFLLSYAEANRYLDNITSTRAIVIPTAYAIAAGAETYNDGTASGWLLRSPGYEQDYAATYGSFYFGCSVDDETVAVRPALWLNTDSDVK